MAEGALADLCAGSWNAAQLAVPAMLELLPCMAFLAADGRITGQNQLAARATDLDVTESVDLERVFLGAFPDTAGEVSEGEPVNFECLLLRRYGLPVAVQGAVRAISPGVSLIVAFEREGGEAETGVLGFGTLLDSAPEAMAITQDGRLVHVNREFTRLFGYEPASCIGHDIDSLLLPEGRLHENEILYQTVETEGRAAIETLRHTHDGMTIAVSLLIGPVTLSGSTVGLFHAFRDIRRQKEQEARLQYSAMHDSLTGLPNRALFLDRLRLTLARMQRRPDRQFAVMFLDLDYFKNVNDTLGHAGGDALLLEVTRRLHECIRPQDTIARFGGDEFAVLLDDVGSRDDIAAVATRLQAAAQTPVVLEGQRLVVSVSIGIAVVTPEYQRADDVVRAADIAMYMAKVNGKGQHAFALAPVGGGATIQPCLESARSRQPA